MGPFTCGWLMLVRAACAQAALPDLEPLTNQLLRNDASAHCNECTNRDGCVAILQNHFIISSR